MWHVLLLGVSLVLCGCKPFTVIKTTSAVSAQPSASADATIKSRSIDQPSPVSISVAPNNPAITLNTKLQFTAAAALSDGSVQDVTNSAKWTLANMTGTFSISPSGLATALTPGTGVVTATLGNLSGTAPITARSVPLVSIVLTPAVSNLVVGNKQTFTATGTFSDGSSAMLDSPSLTWSSTNTTAVSVSSLGVGTAVAAGVSSVSATMGGKVSNNIPVTVTVPALSSIAITPTAASITIGSTTKLNATGNYSDGSTVDLSNKVTWSSSTSAIATVDTLGTVSAKALGTSTISVAAYQNISAKGATINVVTSPVSIVNLHDKQIVQTGFVTGTALGGVSQVGCSYDRGTPIVATGNSTWSCALPTDVNTWTLFSSHTIEVGDLSTGALSGKTSLSVVKGVNRDTNGDGYPDLAVGAPSTGGDGDFVGLLSYNGSPAGIAARPSTLLPWLGGRLLAISLAYGDANGDGYGDVTMVGGGYVITYLGSTSGLSASNSRYSGFLNLVDPQTVALGDVDKNGYDDLFVGDPAAGRGAGAVYVFASRASGFSPTPSMTISGQANLNLGMQVAVADINGDGFGDLVATANSALNSSAYGGAAIVFNGGNQGIGSTPSFSISGKYPGSASSINGGKFGYSLAVGDTNGDGRADIAIGAPYYSTVYIYNGSATGVASTSNASSQVTGSAFFSLSMALGDFNGDGLADLVGGTSNSAKLEGDLGYIYIKLAASDGVSTFYGSKGSTHGLTLIDADGDGRADIFESLFTTINVFNGVPTITLNSLNPSFSLSVPSGHSSFYGFSL